MQKSNNEMKWLDELFIEKKCGDVDRKQCREKKNIPRVSSCGFFKRIIIIKHYIKRDHECCLTGIVL